MRDEQWQHKLIRYFETRFKILKRTNLPLRGIEADNPVTLGNAACKSRASISTTDKYNIF